MVWKIFKYMEHLFHRRHRKGHRIHSPYLFEFVHEVIFNRSNTVVPPKISEMHQTLRRDLTLLSADTMGEESSVNKSKERSVRSFVRRSSVSPKYGAMLFRITQWFNPGMIIELGTGVGVSTMYLAAGAPHCPLYTIEGNPHRAVFATDMIKRSQLERVKVYQGDLKEKLGELIPEMAGTYLAFIDGNHQYGPTVEYLRSLVVNAADEAVIVLDDIYWSRDMFRAWNEVISWPEIRVSIDLYQMGILLLRRDLHKACVKIKF